MKLYFNQPAKWFCMVMALLFVIGLKAQEAQWVYDNNIPDSWSEADWNPEGEIPEKANKIEIGETQEQENQTEETTEETTEEDNVTETEDIQETNETENEEDNVTEVDDMDPDTWFDEDNTHETVTEEEDNVVEEPKKKKRKVAASLIKSSIEDSDSDFGGDVEALGCNLGTGVLVTV